MILKKLLLGRYYIPPKTQVRASRRKFRAFKQNNKVALLERDNYKCKYCLKELTLKTFTLDHVIPISRGGKNIEENLVCACLECNKSKKDDIWY